MDEKHKLLLEQISAGSEPSMSEFYNEFESRVYKFAYMRLNNTFEASEVLNEVMMEVWKNAGKFKGNSKVSTWIFGITHHKTIDLMRKRYRHDHVESEVDPDIIDETPHIDQAILSSQITNKVQQCIKLLKQPFRDIIHLTFFEELHYSDIAKIMDCPKGTIKSRVFHAKSALKNCLASLSTIGETL